jgi:hypothetical protein
MATLSPTRTDFVLPSAFLRSATTPIPFIVMEPPTEDVLPVIPDARKMYILSSICEKATPLLPPGVTTDSLTQWKFTPQPCITKEELDRVLRITSDLSRAHIIAAYMYVWAKETVEEISSALEPEDGDKVVQWLSPTPSENDWDEFTTTTTKYVHRIFPYIPQCTPESHQWNASRKDGACQLCGEIRSTKGLAVVRFVYFGWGEIRFACTVEEWEALAVLYNSNEPWHFNKSAGPLHNFQRRWEALHLLTSFEGPFDDIEVTGVTNLKVELDEAKVGDLINFLELPLITPAFVKYTLNLPCEPGTYGRCFCAGKDRPCSQGRNPKDYHQDDRLSPEEGVAQYSSAHLRPRAERDEEEEEEESKRQKVD